MISKLEVMSGECTEFDAADLEAAMEAIDGVLPDVVRMVQLSSQGPSARVHKFFQRAALQEEPLGTRGQVARAFLWIVHEACADGPPALRFQAGGVRLAERDTLLAPRGVCVEKLVDDLLK